LWLVSRVSESPPEPFFDLESRMWAKLWAIGQADLAAVCWKIVFIVVAPSAITGLSWCR